MDKLENLVTRWGVPTHMERWPNPYPIKRVGFEILEKLVSSPLVNEHEKLYVNIRNADVGMRVGPAQQRIQGLINAWWKKSPKMQADFGGEKPTPKVFVTYVLKECK